MHRIQGWTGLRAAVIALGLVAWTATGATASPLGYTTSGQVDTTTGVTGTNVVSFVPLSSGNSVDLSTGQTNVGLGNFPRSRRLGRRNDNLPEHTHPDQFPAPVLCRNSISSDAPIVVSGVLNGVVNGPSSSTVTATFNPPLPSLLSLGGNGTAEFSLPTSTLLLAPSTSNNGTTSAQGLVTSSTGSESPVPEPSTIARS